MVSEGDLLADVSLVGGGDDKSCRRSVLDGDADGLVDGDLFRGGASWFGAGNELAEFGVHVLGGDHTVTDGDQQVVAPGGKRCQGGTARLHAHQCSAMVASSSSRPARL